MITIRDDESGLQIHFIEGIKVYHIRCNKDYNKLPQYTNPNDLPDYMCQDVTLSETMAKFPYLKWVNMDLSDPKVRAELKRYGEVLSKAYRKAEKNLTFINR